MESLIHCIYASAATNEFSEAELAELLKPARVANAGSGITGILIYAEGSFIQVLEGNAEAVDRVFASIATDPRHEKVTQIIREPIYRRAFAAWTMGYARMTRQDLETIGGFNDFFGAATCLAQADGSRAKKLLSRFAEGRWRSRPDRTSHYVLAA